MGEEDVRLQEKLIDPAISSASVIYGNNGAGGDSPSVTKMN